MNCWPTIHPVAASTNRTFQRDSEVGKGCLSHWLMRPLDGKIRKRLAEISDIFKETFMGFPFQTTKTPRREEPPKNRSMRTSIRIQARATGELYPPPQQMSR